MNAMMQISFFLVTLLLLVKPAGECMAGIYEGRIPSFLRWLGPAESLAFRICGVNPEEEMGWRRYALSMLLASLVGTIALYGLQRLQGFLPLNPQHFGALSPDSAFDTAVSFMTNTDWQGYSGESTMSYFTQMTGLSVQNFLSAAIGMAVAVALIRGFARHRMQTIGNFWVDLIRGILYILLPLSLILALLLVSQGVIQNFSPYLTVHGPQGVAQTLPMGPVASQEAIKEIGTNGGGFFNANSAHPFENPTPFSNYLEMLAIFLIPGGLCHTFGAMVGDRRQGWAILASMTLIFTGFLFVAEHYEQAGNPAFASLGVDQQASVMQSGGNMEGKETRFGIVDSALFATVTTAASCGAVNSMHDSFTPIGGLVPMAQIQLGEVIFGGVGSGLYGMLVYAVIAVFIAGLMIGRTPEYLGKKITAFDIKMASLFILIPPILILGLTALAVLLDAGKAGVANPGAHGFSEILYAFSSAAGNNGSAFAGLSANTPFYNIALGVAMFLGRIWMMIPVLALAGSLAAKKRIPEGAGTMATHTPLFAGLLIGTVILVGALNFVPALALGPVVEQLSMTGVKP